MASSHIFLKACTVYAQFPFDIQYILHLFDLVTHICMLIKNIRTDTGSSVIIIKYTICIAGVAIGVQTPRQAFRSRTNTIRPEYPIYWEISNTRCKPLILRDRGLT